MRRGRCCAVAIAGLWLAQAGSASASTLCVPNISIPGCPAGAANEPTIADAVNNAASSGDTIRIGPDSANGGTYKESVNDLGKSITFIGAGSKTTIIQAQGTPGMHISHGSSAFNLGIQVYPAGGNTGLELAGTATHVAITAQAGVTYAVGVALNGGALRHGTVSLPMSINEPIGFGGVVGPGTVSDSTIAAAVGVADSGAATPNVIRDRIRAPQGVLVGPASAPHIDDSVIHTVSGSGQELGVSISPDAELANFSIRHCTIIGSNTAGSAGVNAAAYGNTVPATSSDLIESTIIRGYTHSISATAISGPFTASTTVTARHTFYDPATSHSTGGAAIHRDSHSANRNPLFVNQAAGNFQLRAGSPAIDAGSQTLGSGESAIDLLGHPRRIVGRKGDGAISDIGAYEFRPHVPAVHATASKSKVAVGKAIKFQATGSDASPGDALSFRWNFGPGASASGATVSHAFKTSGKHKISVTVTDLDRFTATATLTVTVTKPHH
jgi:hypothetical protein